MIAEALFEEEIALNVIDSYMDLEDVVVRKNAPHCHTVRKAINQELQKEFSVENNISTELCKKLNSFFFIAGSWISLVVFKIISCMESSKRFLLELNCLEGSRKANDNVDPND